MKVYLFVLFFVLCSCSQKVYCQNSREVKTAKVIQYQCPPCGCSQDNMRFNSHGICKACKMPLVKVFENPLKSKIHNQIASYFIIGSLGKVYTKIIYPLFAIGILISIFLLFQILKGKSYNLFLTCIILILSLYGFKNQLFAANYSLSTSSNSLFTPISFILSIGPFIFFYTKSITISFKWKPKYFIHFLPSILMFLYYLFLFFMPEDISFKFKKTPYEIYLSHTEQILVVTSGFIYIFLAFKNINRWKSSIKMISVNELSKWLQRLLIGFTLLFLFWGIIIFINYWLYDFGLTTLSYNPLWISFAVILIWLSIEIISNHSLVLSNKPIKAIVLSGSFNFEKIEELKTKLNVLMIDHKIYKNPNLNLETLAKELKINSRYLSHFLNNNLGKKFHDLINQYRVEEAKGLLNDTKHNHLTIEAIGNISGFKSKSSFNSAFKKLTHLTPREFIKQNTPDL